MAPDRAVYFVRRDCREAKHIEFKENNLEARMTWTHAEAQREGNKCKTRNIGKHAVLGNSLSLNMTPHRKR
jgi:hypothetical protein